jgi:hypothetical protein
MMMVFGLDGYSIVSLLMVKVVLTLNLYLLLLMPIKEKFPLENPKKDQISYINSWIWNGIVIKVLHVHLWIMV